MNSSNSPVFDMIYYNTGIDPAYIVLALAVLVVIFFIVMIVVLCKLKKLYRGYDRFMRGQDAESLEDTISACIAKTEKVDEVNQKLQEDIIALRKNQRITYQKMGMVRYDAFQGMKGSLSYVLALLDQKDSGFIINSVYAREGGYSYIKEIVNGECTTTLSEEEQEALKKAKSQA